MRPGQGRLHPGDDAGGPQQMDGAYRLGQAPGRLAVPENGRRDIDQDYPGPGFFNVLEHLGGDLFEAIGIELARHHRDGQAGVQLENRGGHALPGLELAFQCLRGGP